MSTVLRQRRSRCSVLRDIKRQVHPLQSLTICID